MPFFLGTAGLIFLGFLLLTLSIAVVITVYDIRFLAIPTVLLWVLNGTLVIALLTEKFLFPGRCSFRLAPSAGTDSPHPGPGQSVFGNAWHVLGPPSGRYVVDGSSGRNACADSLDRAWRSVLFHSISACAL